MTCDETRDRLEDYAAERLDPAARRALERHLAGCTECRADRDALLALAPNVASLPRSLPPERELWSGIERRMRGRGTRRWALLAASITLLLVPAALLLRSRAPGPNGLAPEVAALVATYQAATDELERMILDAGSGSPAPLSTLTSQLETLDAAIRESAGALRGDPGNEAVRVLLLSAHRKKLHLLQQATARATEG